MAKFEQSSPDEVTFESALAELQAVVTDLEDGSLGLADSITRFEHGMKLLRRCYATLESAEQKIELLTGFDAEGNPVTADFDGDATADTAAKTVGKRSRRKKSPPAKPSDTDDDHSDESAGNRLF